MHSRRWLCWLAVLFAGSPLLAPQAAQAADDTRAADTAAALKAAAALYEGIRT
jgi:hypothetical protein